MKKLFIICLLVGSSLSSMAIGFPVNNAYVHQRIEQSRTTQLGKHNVTDDMIVGVVTPAIDREPIEVKPSSMSFIQKIGSWVIAWVTHFVSSI